MVILLIVWMFLKLVKGKGVISHSSCFDILKIKMERRGNDLNKQIYPYLNYLFSHETNKDYMFVILLIKKG